MRMDRYEDENEKVDLKQSRLNKNQELYADVYLNNAYIDINSLKNEINEKESTKEEVREIKEINNNYTYEEKNYDINELIKKALENKNDDKLNRSLDGKIDDSEIESLIQSINEQQKSEKNDKEDDNLLTDLLPNSDNTVVVPPLSEPILDTSIMDVSEEKDEEEKMDKSLENLEVDDSFVEEGGKGKIIAFIIIIVLLIAAIIGFLIYKGIIKL